MASSFAFKFVIYNHTRYTRASFGVGYSGIALLFSEIADAYYDQRMYMATVAVYEELGQGPAVRHPCPCLRDSLTGHRSRCVASMFWSKLRLVAGMNGDLENSAVIYEQCFISTPSHITYGF